jgi:hemolysin type calcium-binding protein
MVDGGPGADVMQSLGDGSLGLLYANAKTAVHVRADGVPNDGMTGEGDNVEGQVGLVFTGRGNDDVKGTSSSTTVYSGAGDDRIDGRSAGTAGSPELFGGSGDDTILGGAGQDRISGGPGSDFLSGGPGVDTVSYAPVSGEDPYEDQLDIREQLLPVHASIGDGANDGRPGDHDDLRADVENLIGGLGPDSLIGNATANRLDGSDGADVLQGLDGNDRLIGSGGDTLDAGPGRDRLRAAGTHVRLLISDGQPDRANCSGTVMETTFDTRDSFDECAPTTDFSDRLRVLRHHRVRVLLKCPRGVGVQCRGTVRVLRRVHKHRRVYGTARFGPLSPGTHRFVAIRIRRRLPGTRRIAVNIETRTERAGPFSITHWNLPQTIIRPPRR